MKISNLIKFIFPKRCVVCDSILPYGNSIDCEFICNDCKDKIEFIHEPTCIKCGAMINDSDEAYCERCKAKLWNNYISGFGLCRYNDFVKESLHKVKYQGRAEFIEFYGKLIARMYFNKFKEISADYLIPVPIHKKRFKSRNFNQASILAECISKELLNLGLDIKVNNNIAFRVKNTKVLNKLGNAERGSELNDAFYINSVSGVDTVIIVDDIYTTGSTIDKLAEMLKNSGISNIYYAAICVVDNL